MEGTNAEERRDKATKANEKDSKAATTTTIVTATAAVTTPNEFMNMRHSGLWSSVSGLAGSFTSLSLSPPPHPSPGREHATGCHGNNGRKWRRSAQRAEHKHLIRPYLILVMPRNCCCSCSSLLSLLSFAFASRSLPHAVRLSLSLFLIGVVFLLCRLRLPGTATDFVSVFHIPLLTLSTEIVSIQV